MIIDVMYEHAPGWGSYAVSSADVDMTGNTPKCPLRRSGFVAWRTQLHTHTHTHMMMSIVRHPAPLDYDTITLLCGSIFVRVC